MARSKTRVDFEFRANLRSLRGALIAVAPHVGTEPDLPALSRLRVFVSAAGVFVAATDRYSMGLARVSLVDPRPMVLGCFDLDVSSAKLILHVFRPAGAEDPATGTRPRMFNRSGSSALPWSSVHHAHAIRACRRR